MQTFHVCRFFLFVNLLKTNFAFFDNLLCLFHHLKEYKNYFTNEYPTGTQRDHRCL